MLLFICVQPMDSPFTEDAFGEILFLFLWSQSVFSSNSPRMFILNVESVSSADSVVSASVCCELCFPHCLMTGCVLILDLSFLVNLWMMPHFLCERMIVGKKQADGKGAPGSSVHSSWVLPCSLAECPHLHDGGRFPSCCCCCCYG